MGLWAQDILLCDIALHTVGQYPETSHRSQRNVRQLSQRTVNGDDGDDDVDMRCLNREYHRMCAKSTKCKNIHKTTSRHAGTIIR